MKQHKDIGACIYQLAQKGKPSRKRKKLDCFGLFSRSTARGLRLVLGLENVTGRIELL
jgi:hypothetical protein